MNPASNFRRAVEDILTGLSSVHIWPMLGWQDVKQRYRRSILGPFWLTISTGVMVSIMGPLYGKLFNQDIGSYFAFLAVGFVVWQMVSQTIGDCCVAFVLAEGYIKQIKLPLSIHVLRVVWKNAIIFFHNMLVVVVVLIFLHTPVTPGLLLFPVGLLAFAFNAYLYGMIFGMICARFRDIPPIVTNIVQAAFFLTPILWQPPMLGRHQWAVNFNPFYHFVEIIRAPLLGLPTNPASWPAAIAVTAAGILITVAMLTRLRARVAYWV